MQPTLSNCNPIGQTEINVNGYNKQENKVVFYFVKLLIKHKVQTDFPTSRPIISIKHLWLQVYGCHDFNIFYHSPKYPNTQLLLLLYIKDALLDNLQKYLS